MSIFQKIAQFFSGLWKQDIEPWLLDLGHEVQHDLTSTLIPFAAEALAEIGTAVGPSGGDLSARATALGQALTLTLNKAANAGLHTIETDASKEATTALASVIASVQKGAGAANQPVVVQVASVEKPAT